MTFCRIMMIIICAFYRRIWGGWLAPNSALKRLFLVFLAITSCYLSIPDYSSFLNFDNFEVRSLSNIIITTIIVLSFLNPFHSYSYSMNNEDRPIWMCMIVSSLSYGLYTLSSGIIWESITPNSGGFIYCFLGFLVPLGYFISWKCVKGTKYIVCLDKDEDGNPSNCMIDGFGAIGEFWLGMLVLGGPVLSRLISDLIR